MGEYSNNGSKQNHPGSVYLLFNHCNIESLLTLSQLFIINKPIEGKF